MKITLVSFNPLTAAVRSNKEQVLSLLKSPAPKGDLLVLPEAALCGCPLFDLFEDKQLAAENLAALKEIASASKNQPLVLGYVDKQDKQPTTAAAFIYKGKITKIFDTETVEVDGTRVQIVVGQAPQDSEADDDADVVVFLHAQPYTKGNVLPRLEALQKFAKKQAVPSFLCNLLGGGDGMIFDGLLAAADTKGKLIACGELLREQLVTVDTEAKNQPVAYDIPVQQELLDALAFGLRDYTVKSGYDKVIFGVSGGIDSALTAVLAAKAFGGESVHCLSLPSYCTSDLSKSLAGQLALKLRVNLEEIEVLPAFKAVKESMAHIFSHAKDSTDQELQSRLRTTILGALAHEYGAMLISTADKTELSVGPLVIYKDADGRVCPLGDLYKSEIYELARFINKGGELIPQGIVNRAPTPELRPHQTDEDQLPKYDVLDKILQLYWQDHTGAADIARKLHIAQTKVRDVLERVNRADLRRRQTAPVLQVSPCPLSAAVRPVIKKIEL